MSKEIHKLLHKKHISLKEHLFTALAAGDVKHEYIPSEPKKKGECSESYIKRLALEAAKYQFVKVVFNDQVYYVAFSVPGPIVTKHGKFQMIPAEVVGGAWGVHYFLGYP